MREDMRVDWDVFKVLNAIGWNLNVIDGIILYIGRLVRAKGHFVGLYL